MSPRAACRLETLDFSAVYDYTAGKADWLAAGLPTEGRDAQRPRPANLARTDVSRCGPEETIGVARTRVQTGGEQRCVVVSDTGVVLGVLDADALAADEARTADQVIRPGPTTVRAHEDLGGLVERMHARHVTSVIVTDPDGHLIGVRHRDDADGAIAGRRDA